MAIRAPGTPLGSLLDPGYRLPPPRALKPASPTADDEVWWEWSAVPSHGLGGRVWAGCKLGALAATLAAVLAMGLLAAGGGVWWWLGHLASSAHH